jgi:hypothetical protein
MRIYRVSDGIITHVAIQRCSAMKWTQLVDTLTSKTQLSHTRDQISNLYELCINGYVIARTEVRYYTSSV